MKKDTGKHKPVHTRLPTEDVAALDKIALDMTKSSPYGFTWTRASMIRSAVRTFISDPPDELGLFGP